MIRKTITAGFLVALLAGVVAPMAASAGSNAVNAGRRPEVACGFGSCFVPNFGAVGQVVTYKGPAAARVEFADCCTAGDKYSVTLNGPQGVSRTTFTSVAPGGGCSTGPYSDSNAAELAGGATKVRFKAIALPGGTPASAYVRMSSSGWSQVAGPADACGF